MAGVTGDGMVEARTGEPPVRRRTLAVWQHAVLVAVGGFVFGALDLLGQGALKGNWNYAANSISVWLVVAFVAGALIASWIWSAVAGMGVLLAALVGYYVVAPHVVDAGPLNGIAIFWFAAAVVGGPLFGALGQWWRNGIFWQRVTAAALLGGVFVVEGARLIRIVPPEYAPAGWGEILLGLLVPSLIGRTKRERLFGLLVSPLAIALGIVGFALIDKITAHGL